MKSVIGSGRRWISAAVSCLLGLVLAGGPARAQGTGYWSTNGNQLLDANGQPVRIAGINWYGLETTDAVVHGLWAQDYKRILDTVKTLGYNTVRIPFSNQVVETNPQPSNISFYGSTGPINTDLKGLRALEVLDRIIAYSGQIGLKVILDNHRSAAGNSAEPNGLWYTSDYPESKWIADWVVLARRYNGDSTVVGFDLRNEPHTANGGGATWGDGNAETDWRLAAERAGNQVLAINPKLLIIVEGIQAFNNEFYWWGGNLEGARDFPVRLNVAKRLVYSAHDYGPHEYGQSWFNSNTSYASLNSVWTKYWAYLALENIAPVWVGEFGTSNSASDLESSSPGSQGQWFQCMIQFLSENPSIGWTYWALNGEDSYGLLDSTYGPTPVSARKQQRLAGIQFPLFPGGGSTTPDYSISVSPGAVTMAQAGTAAFSINVAAKNGFSKPVSLTVTGLPPGATSSIAPVSVNGGGTATLTVSTGTSTPVGTYALTVAGTSGSVAHTAQATLTVTAPNPPDFTLTMGPSSQTVRSGESTTYTVSSTPASGFSGNVSLTLSGLPAATTANFNPGTIPAAGTATLSVSTSPSTPAGTYPILVTGSSGSKQKTAQTSLGVVAGSGGGSGSCSVQYQVYSDWGTGFVVGVTVVNRTGADVSRWTLSWRFAGNQQITNAWNGVLTQSGPAVSIANANWNGTVPNGASVQFGFQGTYSGSNATPKAFQLNGVSCSVN